MGFPGRRAREQGSRGKQGSRGTPAAGCKARAVLAGNSTTFWLAQHRMPLTSRALCCLSAAPARSSRVCLRPPWPAACTARCAVRCAGKAEPPRAVPTGVQVHAVAARSLLRGAWHYCSAAPTALEARSNCCSGVTETGPGVCGRGGLVGRTCVAAGKARRREKASVARMAGWHAETCAPCAAHAALPRCWALRH